MKIKNRMLSNLCWSMAGWLMRRSINLTLDDREGFFVRWRRHYQTFQSYGAGWYDALVEGFIYAKAGR
jgi:hypothetical protein